MNHLGAGFAIRQVKALAFLVHFIPPEPEDFPATAAGENQQLEGGDGLE